MRNIILLLLAFALSAGSATGLCADPGIEMLQTMPEDGTYTRIGELRLPLREVGDDAFLDQLSEQALNMGADAIVLFDQPAAGESLVMTDDRMTTVGLAIKYE